MGSIPLSPLWLLPFGPYARLGTIQKDYRNATMLDTPSEIVGTIRRAVFGMQPDEMDSICTSHVERHNMTSRTLMKRFTRLGLGFSKKIDNHAAAIAGFLAFDNFVWRTRQSDEGGQPGRLRPTAAMMVGVKDRLWTFEDLFEAAMAA
jgi:hypothetical protein